MTPSLVPALLVHAHVGHWVESLIYAAPVIVILVLLAVSTWRERRRRRRDGEATPP